MFDNLVEHIREQREKQQYINALATVNELYLLLLKEFSDLQKGKAAQLGEDNMSHRHVWRTKYVTFDNRYDGASGMECKCGATLSQDEIERLLNAGQLAKGDISIKHDVADKILQVLHGTEDRGPSGLGWKSDELNGLIDALEAALGAAEAERRKPKHN